MNKGKKRALKWIPIGLIILTITMLITTPHNDKLNKWIMQKYDISCEYDRNVGNVCVKDGVKVTSKSSHFRNAGLYASYELEYRFEKGSTKYIER